MRRAGLAAVVVILLVLVPSVGASSAPGAPPHPGSAGIGDPYFPEDGNGGYDVQHYAIDVGYQPSTDVLTGHTTIRARALEALSRFNLDLDGLRVDGVRVNGVGASWTRTSHELEVTPKHSLAKGQMFVVDVRYHGVPEVLESNSLGQTGFFPTADGALVIGQPHVATTWFPVNDHPRDKATYAIDITVPKGLEAVSNGYLEGKHTQGSRTTWSWRMTEPMASYLATATMGQFDLKSYSQAGISYVDAIDPVLFRNPAPRTGNRYVLSGADDLGYKRLMRTINVPASGGRLTFHVVRDNEPGWDFFAVEARRVGTDSWTTLPDLNGHTSDDTGLSCPFWLSIHPFLAHYQSDNGDDTCSPSGTTGTWNAATGHSDGYETWSVDLSPWAGHQVQLSLTELTDDIASYPGVWVDDIVGPGGSGTTSFEADGNTMDGWTVPGAPAGSPGNAADWRVATSDPRPSIGDRATSALDHEPEILAFLSGVLGPYPFKQAGSIVDDDPSLGFALENQTRPIYSKEFFRFGGEELDSVVTHELAHQWVGDNLALARWQDIWLNEGFATYMEWLWAEDQGRGTAQETFDYLSSFPADSDLWSVKIGDPGPDDLFANEVYVRGGMTLHALRLKIGDTAFFRLLKKWTAKYDGGNVTTPEFVALAEHVSGKHLRGFFKDWLYMAEKPPGLPEPTVLRKGQQKLDASPWGQRLRHDLKR
jgi:peptidase M1-like protein